jgi:glucose dehydrogenase
MEPSDEAKWGVLAAIDLKQRGKLKWTVRTDQPLVGGVLALKSGVVFTGEGNGHLSAFDSLSGKRLWRFQTGAGVNAPPIAFTLDGKTLRGGGCRRQRDLGLPAGRCGHRFRAAGLSGVRRAAVTVRTV